MGTIGDVTFTDLLKSPLQTLRESLQDPHHDYVSLHDLIEAYSILSNRIKQHVLACSRLDHLTQALEQVKTYSSELIDCLNRDIRRVRILDHALERQTPNLGSMYSTPPMTEQDLFLARRRLDVSKLCHHALIFVSDIFVLPLLYCIFSDHDLQSLLHELLLISSMPTLPTPSASKTWSIITWVLSTQRLPSAIVTVKKSVICSTIFRAVNNDYGEQARIDGLKESYLAISNFLTQYPKEFFQPLLPLLPDTLRCLISPDVTCRLTAAYALSGFAHTKITHETVILPQDEISSIIHSFIRNSRGKLAEIALIDVIKVAVIGKESSWKGMGPSWTAAVYTCLVVLADASLFTEKPSIKFFIRTLECIANPRTSAISSLLPCLWKPLLWAFSRIAKESDIQDADDDYDSATTDNVRERAFKVLTQELKGGIGITFAAIILGTEEGQRETNANSGLVISILQDLVSKHGNSGRLEGFLLLKRLVSAVGASRPGNPTNTSPSSIFPHDLINGTLLHCDVGELKELIRLMPSYNLDEVRQFSEEEIVHHWDELLEVCLILMDTSLEHDLETHMNELVHVWQALLLAQAQLTQGNLHLTASSAFATKITSAITRFVIETRESVSQIQRLVLVRKLCTTMTHVFTKSWLSSPAKDILSSILSQDYHLENSSVETAWTQACATLIFMDLSTLVNGAFQNIDHTNIHIRKQLWKALCQHIPWDNEDMAYNDIIKILLIPFEFREMSDMDMLVWEDTYRRTISLSSDKPRIIVDRFLQRLDKKHLELLQSVPHVVLLLLKDLAIADRKPFATEIFNLVDRILYSNYPPSAEKHPTMMDILYRMGAIIASCPSSLVVGLISILQKSFCYWIGDERNILSNDDHDTIVTSVYCNALDNISLLEPTMDILHTLSPFLVSVFSRANALGPKAFVTYWRSKYHDRDDLQSCPSDIQVCLKAWSVMCEDSLGDAFSIVSESQHPPSTVVPASPESKRKREVPYMQRRSQGSTKNALEDPSTRSPSSSKVALSNGSQGGKKRPADTRRSNSAKRRKIELASIQEKASPISNFSIGKDCSLGPTTRSRGFSAPLQRLSPRNQSDGKRGPSSAASTSQKHKQPANVSHEYAELPKNDQRVRKSQSAPGTPNRLLPSPPSLKDASLFPDEIECEGAPAGVVHEDIDYFQLNPRSQQNNSGSQQPNARISPPLKYRPGKRRTYSQRTPEPSSELRPPPLKRSKTTSARLDALENAFAVVTETEGVSQVPIEDLLRATCLANQINVVLNDQMSKKLAAEANPR